jgi:hypothetical protein
MLKIILATIVSFSAIAFAEGNTATPAPTEGQTAPKTPTKMEKPAKHVKHKKAEKKAE